MSEAGQEVGGCSPKRRVARAPIMMPHPVPQPPPKGHRNRVALEGSAYQSPYPAPFEWTKGLLLQPLALAESGGSKRKEAPNEGPRRQAWRRLDALRARGAKPLSKEEGRRPPDAHRGRAERERAPGPQDLRQPQERQHSDALKGRDAGPTVAPRPVNRAAAGVSAQRRPKGGHGTDCPRRGAPELCARDRYPNGP